MNMKDSKDILSSLLKTTQMGQVGIRSVEKAVNGSELKKALRSQLQEYDKIEQETSLFRKRLHLLLFLSELGELAEQSGRENGTEALPAYVSEALSYSQEHYTEKLVATELASRLHIGRTTLMTAFKHYTGSTLGDYVTGCRLKHAIELLRTGETAQHVAEQCGFGDSCNLIRCFRRKLGVTPMQYVKKAKES